MVRPLRCDETHVWCFDPIAEHAFGSGKDSWCGWTGGRCLPANGDDDGPWTAVTLCPKLIAHDACYTACVWRQWWGVAQRRRGEPHTADPTPGVPPSSGVHVVRALSVLSVLHGVVLWSAVSFWPAALPLQPSKFAWGSGRDTWCAWNGGGDGGSGVCMPRKGASDMAGNVDGWTAQTLCPLLVSHKSCYKPR